jgi:hypothetical protein
VPGLSEEEARGRYQYGKEPPTQENYASEFEHFRKTPHGQKIGHASDFNENIRVVENYSNIRDLEGTAHTEIQEPVKQEIDVPRKVDDQKEKAKIFKDTGIFRKESSQSTDAKYYSKQPVNFNLPKTIEGSVHQPIVMDRPTESESESELNVVGKKKVNINTSPIRITASSSYTTLETPKHDRDRDSGSLSSNLKESVNPVRTTTKEHEGALTHPTTTTTSTSTTMDKPENSSRTTSPLSSIYMSHDNIITRTDVQNSFLSHFHCGR